MIIDISSILNGEQKSIDFEGEVKLQDFEFSGEKHELVDPVKVVGSVTSQGGIYELKLEIKARIKALCSRCTKPLIHELEFENFETLSTKMGEDIIFIEGTTVDLNDIVLFSIISNMPIRFLCSNDCKGLCPKCGKDKNLENCTCDKDYSESVFSKLDELFGK